MTLAALHGYVVGFLLIGAWAVLALWALALRLTGRHTPLVWRAVSVAQILLALQLVVGLVLLVLGRRPGPAASGTDLAFHLAYGIVFPLVVLVVGHRVAREGRYSPHTTFAVVGLVIFGLTARAWMVGVVGA